MPDDEKFFKRAKKPRLPDEEDTVELAEPKQRLEVPGHHQALSQNQLLQEILSHRKALIQARAMAVDGTADSEGILGNEEADQNFMDRAESIVMDTSKHKMIKSKKKQLGLDQHDTTKHMNDSGLSLADFKTGKANDAEPIELGHQAMGADKKDKKRFKNKENM